MNTRTGYRIAYSALVFGLLFACVPVLPAAPNADSVASDDRPVGAIASAGAIPTDAVQPASAPTAAPTPPTPSATATAAPPFAATPDEILGGREVYNRTCVMCHGPGGVGIAGGPPKVTGLRDLVAIKRITSAGSANMPPMAGLLTAQEIDHVSKFVAAGLPAP